MGNLGAYQWMTTLAKKVGGPLVLGGITALSGYVVLRGGEAGVKKGIKVIKGKIIKKESSVIYRIIKDGKDNSGLEFRIGDEYRILERDGDSILIEKLGDANNPYFVSREFLLSISDNNATLE